MRWSLLILLLVHINIYAQKTGVSGLVTEKETGEPVPFASVFFKDSKIGTETDLDGKFMLSSYYATDSLTVRASGFASQTVAVVKDKTQEINFQLGPVTQITEEVVIRAPDEKPSTILHRRVVRNKNINNKAKLTSYEYESYNKIQLDLNNIGDKFSDRKIVQNLDVVMEYLDTMNGGQYLPLILTESLSEYYYRTNPKKKKEVVKASRITGVENLEVNQFLGEMYQDINVYDNYIGIFDKSFISPIANFAMGYYRFRLTDSMFIDNQWCYQLTFKPKRKGDLTFEGEMWIHDTTYAVKQWTASVADDANINYVNGFYLEQMFNQVEDEVWMLTYDRLIVDLKVYEKSKLLGFYGRKLTTRKDFVINKPHPVDFYKTSENVVIEDGAEDRDEAYWKKHRHVPLNKQEEDIDVMIDSLNEVPLFKAFKNLTFLATTGFYPLGKVELGNIKSLISYNTVEGFRNQIQLRTSNDFSERIELSGKVAYGYLDQNFKYGGGIRYNITPKKRGMLNLFYDYDVKQLGLGDNAEDIDAAFGSLLRTRPLTQLTLVEKFGVRLEKDIGKSFIFTVGGQWKNLTALGATQFRVPTSSISYHHINDISTFETSLKIRYAKNEEFISGTFDRISIGSKYPIFSLEGVLGIKGILGSDYEYQKLELKMKHSPKLGVFGKLFYEVYGGIYFGQAAYPLLQIHEGSQTYWFQSAAHNRMDYFEFISDRYVGATAEHHFNGLFFDRIPLVRKLKWRLVASAKSVWGELSDKQKTVMMIPDNTIPFGNTPYVESAIGIENIFKVFRVDAVWRMTHLREGDAPVGIRAKFTIRF
ncbi:hypothetical protein CW751_04890 [Brumimicrobium salinarum]|uniref:Carboxypeptidase-like regulatory domain-containing protein n=1 Tax=Brumimicrobium salinarum TaxID=2058658 RepID=A0A2I0R488_9FLAO|nr:DUF5686 and carboxypeptidase-like regulatory domain-containing protein [Brumimicrobium salinarum]PKR81396.1 hypothetical protein CW751_04890 [Brumimicrobium salinarum]